MRALNFARTGVCILSVAVGFSAAQSNPLDCAKIQAALCAVMKSASDTDKLIVNIGFYHQGADSSCKGVDPKTDTTGKCNRAGWDSAYGAKLLNDARDLFDTYELWSGKNPIQRLQAPTEPKLGFMNVVATKATLVLVSQESYVNFLERYVEGGPQGVKNRLSRKIYFQSESVGDEFQVNGRKLDQKFSSSPRSVLIHK